MDRGDGLDHLVVVMFENRSFDNLLGRLYQPGEVASFEGVTGKELSNPVPGWAEHGADKGLVPYGVAANMDTPNPDPGEEYQHVNTQLFGSIDPPENRGRLAEQMAAPYNAPADGQPPTMDGFVADYISAFWAEVGRQPSYQEYAQIMTGYTPEQLPVLSTLARGFATFDHRFAEVPSQTFTNRSFVHAASASGFVVNSPYANFPLHNHAETLFERLEAKGLSWRVYADPPSQIPFTGLIHAPRLPPLRHPLPLYRPVPGRRQAGHPADLCVHRAQPVARPQRHAPADVGPGPRLCLRRSLLGARRRGAGGQGLQRDPFLGLVGWVELLQHPAAGAVRRARRDLRPRPPTTGDPAGSGPPGRAAGLWL
jgi:hypothetical protein